jgi:DNA-binding CsgD family transcriptional regulator
MAVHHESLQEHEQRIRRLLVIKETNAELANVLNELTVREYQVFWRLLEDETVTEIAKSLGLNLKTIDTFKASILRKLGLKNRISLVRWAVREGLIQGAPLRTLLQVRCELQRIRNEAPLSPEALCILSVLQERIEQEERAATAQDS